MKFSIPFLVEGEVYEVQKHVGSSRKPIRYVCKAEMPDGSTILLPNCIQSTLFGGIDDYLQFRSRSSSDSGADTETSSQDEKNSAQIGDRVYIAFVSGNIQKPVIIGYAQHPNQTYEFENEDPAEIDPRMVFKYLGVKCTVDEKGQLRIIHRGAPEIKYSPRAGELGAALAAAGSLLNPSADKANQAVEPKSEDETTVLELLEGGVWRVRDSEGQVIEIDRTKKRVFLSSNDLKSTEKNSTVFNPKDAEFLKLDKDEESATLNARKLIQIESADKRNDTTKGNYEHKIGGNNTTEISGSSEEKITKGWTVDVSGDVKFSSSGKAFLTMSNGKVTFGGPAAELLDLVNQFLQTAIDLTASMQNETHIGNLGYNTAPPTNLADYVKANVTLQKIKTLLGQIKG